MIQRAATRAVTRLFDLYAGAGQRDYLGECVSQMEHALQCAHFARAAGASGEQIVAALLHDVGHLCAGADAQEMEGLGIADHEVLGARYLRGLGFGAEVVQLVEGHVAAKRYLTWKNPEYLRALSAASVGTLALQGGPMSADEARSFERQPRFREMLRLRMWDEKAKQLGLRVEGLESYHALIVESLQNPE